MDPTSTFWFIMYTQAAAANAAPSTPMTPEQTVVTLGMFTLCIVLIMLFCWLSTRPQKPIVRIQRHPRHWRLP